jgi:7-cyano-7-deazaguanine synthase
MPAYDSVILSGGGMESLVLLALAAKERRNPLVVYVTMNEGTDPTLSRAEQQCRFYGFTLHNVAASCFFGNLSKNLPATNDRKGYIPGYRHILLSSAFQIADHVGARKVFLGEHADWPESHPLNGMFDLMVGGHHADRELDPKFWWKLLNLYNETYGTSIELVTPFLHLSKGQVVKIGQDLGVNWSLSLTCRKGLPLHCGASDCFFCESRKEAFKEANVKDHVAYGRIWLV